MNDDEPGRKAPADVRRLLRQRCGFGCALCGSPVFDYEHIEGFAVTGHNPDAMTLLCPTHHREKTVRRMPVEVVRRAALHPHNATSNLGRRHELYFDETNLEVHFGNLAMRPAPGHAHLGSGLAVDGVIALGFQVVAGRLVFSADIRDIDNRPILQVREGALRLGTSPWDITFESNRLRIRSAPKRTILDLRLEPPNLITVTRGVLFNQFVGFRLGSDAETGGLQIHPHGGGFGDLTIEGVVAVGEPPSGTAAVYQVRDVPRSYGGPPCPPGVFRR